MNSLRIGARLTAGFGVMLLLCSVLGILAITQLSRVNNGADMLANNWMPSIRELGQLQAQANSMRRGTLRHVLETTAEGKNRQKASTLKAKADLQQTWATYYPALLANEDERKLADDLKAKLDAWLAMGGSLAGLV